MTMSKWRIEEYFGFCFASLDLIVVPYFRVIFNLKDVVINVENHSK